MVKYEVSGRPLPGNHIIQLPASKSICNRALVIAALCNGIDQLENLSTADDSQLLLHYLQHPEETNIHAGHGGTTLRFLLAYKAIQGVSCTLTGSDNLNMRPIGPLVEALKVLGCRIEYTGQPGFPPLRIYASKLKSNRLILPADVSSQFISAILLIAPYLPEGITIELTGTVYSRSYIDMTLAVMHHFGANTSVVGNTIVVYPEKYEAKSYSIESDWSAASYFYALSAFCPESSFILSHLVETSIQGDSAMLQYGKAFGIESKFTSEGCIIQKTNEHRPTFQADLINEPDLTLALAVMCAGCKMGGKFNGLETLRIKETDRIAALHHELSKVGVNLIELPLVESFKYYLKGNIHFRDTPTFDTYHDHRMAMSLAVLGVFHKVFIKNPMVVTKSFPDFWEKLKSIGMHVTQL